MVSALWPARQSLFGGSAGAGRFNRFDQMKHLLAILKQMLDAVAFSVALAIIVAFGTAVVQIIAHLLAAAWETSFYL